MGRLSCYLGDAPEGAPWGKRASSLQSWSPTLSATAGLRARTRGSHLGAVRALRSDLVDPTIALHHGRIVKQTGDGSMVEFSSVVDAMRCAIEVQNGMIERNAGVPAERRIEFRVGVHLGDVVEEADGDLMGDGVNIATRLESIAKPGAICLSQQAYWQVKGRLDLPVHDLGPTQLKNIAEPIGLYLLEVGKVAQVKPAPAPAPENPLRRASRWLQGCPPPSAATGSRSIS